MDDEYVIMDENQKSCVIAYQRVFPGEKFYKWQSKFKSDYIFFKIIRFGDNYRNITVFVEIIDYKLDGVNKKMIEKSIMDNFKYKMKMSLSFDFSICSIKFFDIIIVNESKFLLPEKQKNKPEFKIYTGLRGMESLRSSSYDIFNSDDDDDTLSYSRFIKTNKLG